MSIHKLSFQLLSDIHLELSGGSFPKIPITAPYLILAGDITNINHESFGKFFKYCNDNWNKTFYVPGNHEYYSKSNTIHKMKSNTIHEMKSNTIHEMKLKMINHFQDNQLNNIIFLDNGTYEIESNIFIIGSTFWTPSPYPNNHHGSYSLNDYNMIHWEKNQTISPQNINDLANNDYTFINEQIEKFKDKKIILLTHFPPTQNKTSHPKYINQPELIKNYFCWPNNTIPLFNKYNNILCWISGHTHYSYDFVENNVRLLSNQLGYRDELLNKESNFNPNTLYEIDL